MIRLIITLVLNIIGNAIGLIVASVLLSGFSLNLSGFIAGVLIFSLAEFLLGPFILKMSIKYLPTLRGGIALVTTLVSLILATIFSNGIQITGLSTWFISSFIIWVSVILAGVILPLILFKKALSKSTPSSE